MNSRHEINNIGYLGNKVFNLKYIARTRNFRYTWPHNNLFNNAKDENCLLRNILSQNVGFKINEDFSNEKLEILKNILKRFLNRHRNTNYKKILRKCLEKESNFSRSNECSVSRQVMKEFLHRIIFNIIPSDLFGSKTNQIQFERNLRRILHFGKSQVYTLKIVLNKLVTKNFKFLKPFSENIVRTNLIAKIFIWLIRTYIFAALKCVFYITESNHSNKFIFYEKHVWQKIQQNYLNNIKKTVIRNYKSFPINSRMINSKNLYILKILPKFRGNRPVYVRWRNDEHSKLKAAHEVSIMRETLKKIASIYLSISQTTSEEFHSRWLQLYFTWLTLGKPQVYFIRVDFIDAFGSIDQIKLMKTIERLKNRCDASEIEYNHLNVTKKIELNAAFPILQNYITNFQFKNNQRVYKLTRGICQGGSLSSALCSLYFTEVNLTHLLKYMNDPMGFFVQNCDDYLYITMNLSNATSFLERMEEGFPEFNLSINRAKTETNIRNHTNHVTNFGQNQIDVNTFQVYSCYKSYQRISTFHKSTFRSLTSPGKILYHRLLIFSSMKMHKIYFDCNYNTVYTIVYNIFLVSFLTAIRCVSLIKAIFTHFNTNYIYACVLRCTSHISRMASKRVQENTDILNAVTFKWIALKAFHVKMKTTNRDFSKLAFKIQRFLDIISDGFDNRQRSEILEKFHRIQPPLVLKNLS